MLYAILSAPGVHLAALAEDSEFMIPSYKPQYVFGSFFTKVSLVLRGESMRIYGVRSDPNVVGFDVFELDTRSNPATPNLVKSKRTVWSEWSKDGIRVLYKQSTIVARAGGWEVNCTRKPTHNQVSGSSEWHFDIAMRMLDGHTSFESIHGTASKTCLPHGLIGQSYDTDDVAVDGNRDDYSYRDDNPTVTMRAQAEGAIEGAASDYTLPSEFDVEFAFSRFGRKSSESCAARNVTSLGGRKGNRSRPLLVGAFDP
tara:strand:- start:2453 stop:3220 length:768 start_codon:yes stop_codon:yes gene_type:complete